ncbi:MAG: hypothetical protein L0Z50_09550, partial [Verrucomicrobiales bacterium]|nr:hypothetical protein [Verrucomicrobiales bacterium]
IHKLSVTERGVHAASCHARPTLWNGSADRPGFVLKRRERPRSRCHRQLVDARLSRYVQERMVPLWPQNTLVLLNRAGR